MHTGLTFYRGEKAELDVADNRLNTVLNTQRRIVLWQLALNISINAFDYVATILSYLIVAIPILHGRYTDTSSSDISSIISKVSPSSTQLNSSLFQDLFLVALPPKCLHHDVGPVPNTIRRCWTWTQVFHKSRCRTFMWWFRIGELLEKLDLMSEDQEILPLRENIGRNDVGPLRSPALFTPCSVCTSMM